MQSSKREPCDKKLRGKHVGLALIAVFVLGAALAFQGLTAPASPGASASSNPAAPFLPIQGPATLVFQKGEVALGEAAPGGEVAWKPAASGMAVLPGMRIRTSEGYADLLLPGWNLIRIAPHAELALTRTEIVAAGQVPQTSGALPQAQDGQAVTRLFLSIGRIWVHVIKQLNYVVDFEVQTPSAVAGVRGTIFSVMVAADGSTVVSVQKGKVLVSAEGESKMVDQRQESRSKAGEPLRRLPKLSREETSAWEEQEDWLREQEELDKQVEKEQKLQEKGGAGDQDTGKNGDGQKESDEDTSEHKEREGFEGKSDADHGRSAIFADGKMMLYTYASDGNPAQKYGRNGE